MLSLGNFYFEHHGGSKADSQLKESYKFFFHVLNENHRNAFAANGLGMVCAKKSELDVARETFAKARESNVAMAEVRCMSAGAFTVVMQCE
jgi:Flp pilus assembly protein TadD